TNSIAGLARWSSTAACVGSCLSCLAHAVSARQSRTVTESSSRLISQHLPCRRAHTSNTLRHRLASQCTVSFPQVAIKRAKQAKEHTSRLADASVPRSHHCLDRIWSGCLLYH